MNEDYKPNTGWQTTEDFNYYHQRLRNYAMDTAAEYGHRVVPAYIWDERTNLSIIKNTATYELVYAIDGEFYAVHVRYDFDGEVSMQHVKVKSPMFPLNWPY